ncbi:MAG: IS630 family transposase [Planctomycetota bacterium]
MDWSCQKPERRARERNEEAIARWRKQDWPRIKKARRSDRSIVFIDESGFMLQPVVRRTWAPRGQTPVHHSWDRHDRLSAISALTVSPRRRRLGLYFDIHEHNIGTEEVESFICWLQRRFPNGIILVLDRLSAHRSAAKRLVARYGCRVDVEWLPPYAPELNPVEQVWDHTKYADLAN